MKNRAPEYFRSRLEIFPGVVGALAMAAGVLVLAGWTWDIDRLKRILPGLVSMNPMTAVAFILAGFSLWLQRRAPANTTHASLISARRIAQFGALLVFAVGLLKLVNYLFGWEFGIDQLLFAEKLLQDNPSLPNRMAPNTALNFIFLGLALLRLDVTTRRGHRPAEFFALAILLISLAALIGYAYRAQWLYGVANFIPMALHTAVVFHLLALGILCARPGGELMAVVMSGGPSGVLARRLLPSILPIVAILGWLCLEGGRQGFYDAESGVTLFAMVNIMIFSALIWWSAKSLHRADASLRASEENLDVTLQSIGDGVLATDTEGRVTWLNAVAEALTGWSQAEAVGRPVAEVFHVIAEETGQPALIPAAETLARGTVHGLANRTLLIARDGEERSITDSCAPIRNREGRVVGAVLVFRDVTQERAQELWHQSILETAIDGFWAVDREGRILTVNQAYCRMSGYSREELLRLGIADLEAVDRPEDIGRRIQKVIATGSDRFESRHRHKDGSVFDVQVSTQYTSWLGGSFVAFIQDISERKEAEKALRRSETKFRTLYEATSEAVMLLTEKGFFDCNPTTLAVFGCASREEFCSKHPADLSPPRQPCGTNSLTLANQRIATAMETGSHRFEWMHRRTDTGEVFPAEVLLTQMQLDGKPVLQAVVRNITERKLREEEVGRLNADLSQRSAALEVTNQELESFSYSVSHDLRAPLRAIDGFSLALLDDYADKLDEEGKENLAKVRAATQRMGHLIDDLLNLARVTRSEMRFEKVNLTALAKDIAAEHQRSEPERRVKFAIAEGLEANADRGLVQAVLENLIGNAWKFTAKRADANIDFGVVLNNGKPAYFVGDNGAGFDIAYADKLFGAFQRLHSQSEFPGTGIGLATVRRIVRRHGGDVWAEGKPNEGATFYFTLSD